MCRLEFFWRNGSRSDLLIVDMTSAFHYLNNNVNYRSLDMVTLDGMKVHDRNWDFQSNHAAKRMPA